MAVLLFDAAATLLALAAIVNFKKLEPLKSGRGIESHRITASVDTVHGKQYVMVNRASHDLEQAERLYDWLGRALGKASAKEGP